MTVLPVLDARISFRRRIFDNNDSSAAELIDDIMLHVADECLVGRLTAEATAERRGEVALELMSTFPKNLGDDKPGFPKSKGAITKIIVDAWLTVASDEKERKFAEAVGSLTWANTAEQNEIIRVLREALRVGAETNFVRICRFLSVIDGRNHDIFRHVGRSFGHAAPFQILMLAGTTLEHLAFADLRLEEVRLIGPMLQQAADRALGIAKRAIDLGYALGKKEPPTPRAKMDIDGTVTYTWVTAEANLDSMDRFLATRREEVLTWKARNMPTGATPFSVRLVFEQREGGENKLVRCQSLDVL
jgi:hypothetical protein